MKKIKELNLYKNILWFTLVELVVGITISMLLMVSVGIFVSTWMSNITLQTKILDDNEKNSYDFLYLSKTLNYSKWQISSIWTATWLLLRQNKYFDKWWFSYIWVWEFDKKYCESWVISKTNHLFVNNFIPYEEIGEDININFSETLNSDSTNYISDILNHQITRKSTSEVVVWKDLFWDKFTEWSFWTWVFLNSPTWLVEVEWKLIFSDTLNDRILYLSGSLVYKLLDEKNWLEEPTWLAYDDLNKILYIANSGAWEILKFSSNSFSINPNLNIVFRPDTAITNINKIKIEILNNSNIFTNPDNESDFTFTNIPKKANDFVNTDNQKINYYFIDSYDSENVQWDCDWTNNGIIINVSDNIINCISSWTWRLANYWTNFFSSLSDYTIDISGINPILSDNKNYYVKLNLLNNNTILDEKYFPYFTQWDDDIFTLEDNTLETLAININYPTGISISWWNLLFNEFETREQKRVNISNWNISNSSNLTAFSNNTFEDYNKNFIFSNPIKKLEIDSNWGLLSLKMKYYKYLNCFSPEEQIERTFLIKKDF